MATITRKTNETDVSLTLNLDGSGKSDVSTGVGFLDHMLTLFAAHGRFDLDVRCTGDVEVDGHHSVEDVGIALGEAVLRALDDKKGIVRYGSMLLPMDEALVLCAVDLSGRACLRYRAEIPAEGRFVRHGTCKGVFRGVYPKGGTRAAYPPAGRRELASYHRGDV